MSDYGIVTMKPKGTRTYYLFYAGLLVEEHHQDSSMMIDHWPMKGVDVNDEIYNGGYIYQPVDQRWYRCDFTPVLLEDVPKELRVAVLLLT